jgi:hypothetical protein
MGLLIHLTGTLRVDGQIHVYGCGGIIEEMWGGSSRFL